MSYSVFPVTGKFQPTILPRSSATKTNRPKPGYYQVNLERYGINAELTSTLHCGFHQYSSQKGQQKKLVLNLSRSNERVREKEIEQVGTNAFTGFQQTGEKIYFYAETNHDIVSIEILGEERPRNCRRSFWRMARANRLKLNWRFRL